MAKRRAAANQQSSKWWPDTSAWLQLVFQSMSLAQLEAAHAEEDRPLEREALRAEIARRKAVR
jgi:hypothetical protein